MCWNSGTVSPRGWDGGYFPSERRITVRPSVPREHFGQAFAAGSVQFVTDAAKSETEAIQRNLVHEIGHLLLDQESRAVKRYVRSVFQRNRDTAISHYGRRNSRGGKPGTASQFQRRELVAVPALRRAHRVKTCILWLSTWEITPLLHRYRKLHRHVRARLRAFSKSELPAPQRPTRYCCAKCFGWE
jgi:hypothetical protein